MMDQPDLIVSDFMENSTLNIHLRTLEMQKIENNIFAPITFLAFFNR